MSLSEAFAAALQTAGIGKDAVSAPSLDASGVPTLGAVGLETNASLEQVGKELKEAEGNAPGASVQIEMEPDF